MELAWNQETLEPETGGCEELLFPKPFPPPCCCWKKPPPVEGEVVEGVLDAGVAWFEVGPVTWPATRPVSIPKTTMEPAIRHFLHVCTNSSACAFERRGEASAAFAGRAVVVRDGLAGRVVGVDTISRCLYNKGSGFVLFG